MAVIPTLTARGYAVALPPGDCRAAARRYGIKAATDKYLAAMNLPMRAAPTR